MSFTIKVDCDDYVHLFRVKSHVKISKLMAMTKECLKADGAHLTTDYILMDAKSTPLHPELTVGYYAIKHGDTLYVKDPSKDDFCVNRPDKKASKSNSCQHPDQLNGLRDQLENVTKKVQDLKLEKYSRIDELEREIADLEAELLDLRRENRKRIYALESQNKERIKTMNQAQQENDQKLQKLMSKNESLERRNRRLAREVQELKDQNICLICMDKPRNVVIQPCSHLLCCGSCADRVLRDFKKCSLCSSTVTRMYKIYK